MKADISFATDRRVVSRLLEEANNQLALVTESLINAEALLSIARRTSHDDPDDAGRRLGYLICTAYCRILS